MDQATGSGTETGPTATRRQRDRTKTATRPPRSGKDSKELEGTTRRNRGHPPSVFLSHAVVVQRKAGNLELAGT